MLQRLRHAMVGLSHLVHAFEQWVSLLLMVVMIVLVFAQVFFRYVLGSPLVWSEELARYTFIWITFVGSAFVAARGSHIAVSYFVERMPRRTQDAVAVAASLAVVAGLVTILPSGLRFVAFMDRIGSSAMGIPMSFVYAAIPIGLALVGVEAISSAAAPLLRLLRYPAPTASLPAGGPGGPASGGEPASDARDDEEGDVQ